VSGLRVNSRDPDTDLTGEQGIVREIDARGVAGALRLAKDAQLYFGW
jgi:hypothetical protein